ncbi:hypothetical protein M426DRAFT_191061 [Hypoxylon sp. CI-4A]|nr:hypothetical protein M426DRAFT_191061 [Hypoxylon sp. CI-4A]
MDTPLKRASPSDDDQDQSPEPKRQRTEESDSRSTTPAEIIPPEKASYEMTKRISAGDPGREGLKRSIAMALKQVGFDSAEPEALESFTENVDTYLTGFVSDLHRVSNAARRNDIIPTDFEYVLHRHNLPLSALKPHLKNTVPKDQLPPTYFDPIKEDVSHLLKTRPYLSEELSGKKEKEERPWIPKGFPPFAPPFTYKFTPLNQTPNYTKEQLQAEADAKKAELALRHINRAARISRQKDLRAIAQRQVLGKQRNQAWEGIMTELLPPSKGVDKATEIADHSTIVNFGAKYGRKGVPKASRRAQADPMNGLN